MIVDRYAAVSGVPQGIRGGFFNLYRSSGQAQVSYRVSGASICRTKRHDRQARGDWMGKHSLRQDAVFSVRRQPMAIQSSANRKTDNEKDQSLQTRGVGITVQTLAEKGRAQDCGETLVPYRSSQDCELVDQSSVV